jgi:hypothetical protein
MALMITFFNPVFQRNRCATAIAGGRGAIDNSPAFQGGKRGREQNQVPRGTAEDAFVPDGTLAAVRRDLSHKWLGDFHFSAMSRSGTVS